MELASEAQNRICGREFYKRRPCRRCASGIPVGGYGRQPGSSSSAHGVESFGPVGIVAGRGPCDPVLFVSESTMASAILSRRAQSVGAFPFRANLSPSPNDS